MFREQTEKTKSLEFDSMSRSEFIRFLLHLPKKYLRSAEIRNRVGHQS